MYRVENLIRLQEKTHGRSNASRRSFNTALLFMGGGGGKKRKRGTPSTTDNTELEELQKERNKTWREKLAEEDCTICLEKMGTKNIIFLPCGHAFHAPCLNGALKHASQCSICRLRVPNFSTVVPELLLQRHTSAAVLQGHTGTVYSVATVNAQYRLPNVSPTTSVVPSGVTTAPLGN